MADLIEKTIMRLEKLPDSRKFVVYYVTMAGCPVVEGGLLQCMSQGGHQAEIGESCTRSYMTNAVKSLKKQGLLIVEGEGISPAPDCMAAVARFCSQHGHMASVLDVVERVRNFGHFYQEEQHKITRTLWRSCWERSNPRVFPDALARFSNRYGRLSAIRKLGEWFLPFDPQLVKHMMPPTCMRILDEILNFACLELLPIEGALEAALYFNERKMGADANRFALAHGLLWNGRLEEAERVLAGAMGLQGEALKGCLASLRGSGAEALTLFRKVQRNKPDQLYPIAALFYLNELMRTNTRVSLDEGVRFLAKYPSVLGISASRISSMAFTLRLRPNEEVQGFGPSRAPRFSALEALVRAMYRVWFDAKGLIKTDPRGLFDMAVANGYALVAREVARVMNLQDKQDTSVRLCDDQVRSYLVKSRDNPGRYLVDALWKEPEWETALAKLSKLQPAAPVLEGSSSSDGKTAARLVWHIAVLDGRLMIQPREQRMNTKGEWGKGRPISLARLAPGSRSGGYFTEQDHRACDCIIDNSVRGAGQGYSFDSDQAALALLGHPLLFCDGDESKPLKLVKAAPEVHVSKVGEEILIEMVPRLIKDRQVQIEQDSPTRIKVVRFDENHRAIAPHLARTLTIPAEHAGRVSQAIDNLSAMITVQSEMRGESAREVEPDGRIQVQLQPHGKGLRVSFLAQPLGETGPVFKPGSGSEGVIAEISGELLQTIRDLPGEVAAARDVNKVCTAITLSLDKQWEWVVDELENCLRLVEQLRDLEGKVVISWPEGGRFSLTPALGSEQMRVSITKVGDWFGLDGELALEQDQTIDFRRLLEMTASASGRYIPLGDRRFLALTDSLRERLERLEACAERSEEGLRIHPGAVLSLGDFTEGMEIRTLDQSWQDHLSSISALSKKSARMPAGLKAELRPYQKEGFRWLSRLSRWGFGACLADDMGLGKTLQALTVIVERAAKGPTLVIAPASVTTNWVEEAGRFAPGLKVHLLGDGDREQLTRSLGPKDLLISSYGKLNQEAELLASVRWRTAVLDEAQAIKNPATRRARAAMALDAEFRLILTGTPIENHLGELWSLFHFINPGLLGSLGKFNRRFLTSVVKMGNSRRRDTLKRLIQPFILRRLKGQVLKELPPKTEVQLNVELSSEEWSLYKTVREEAIADLEADQGEGIGQYPRVLAQIMRLRRVCCHPRLTIDDYPLMGGAKLKVFGPLMDDLLESNHKVLVFSQFVDHLQIMKEYLDDQGVAYQYLDGSTPARQRTRSIDAFQSGQGDVFLISLKAGGTGLNLTAADYILHMDPWWNPAVEDQASDRAHRIGQDKPVTVYRLITRGTIEEKIVRLHKEKRALADQLLEGQDMTGKMSTEDLLRLIREH